MRIPLAPELGQRVAEVAPGPRPQSGDGGVGEAAQRLGGTVTYVAQQEMAAQEQLAEQDKRQRLRDILEQNNARMAADKAQASARSVETRDALDSMHQQFDEDIQTGQIDKTKAIELWRKRATEAIASGAKDVPDAYTAPVQASLMSHAGRLEGKVQRSVTKRDRSDVAAGIEQTLEYAQRLATTDPAAGRQVGLDALEQLGPFAGLPPDQIAKKKQGFLEGVAYTRAYTALYTAKNDNGSLRAADKAIAADETIDPQKKATLLATSAGFQASNEQRAEAAAARAQRQAEARLKRAEAEFNVFQSLADKGGALDPAYVDRVSQATAGTPYQAGIKALAEQAVTTGGLALQPLDVQRQSLQALDAQIAKTGRTEALDKRRGQVEKVLRASEADIKTAGIGAYAERGGGVAPPIDLRSLETLGASMQARVTYTQQASAWARKTLSPFTQDEAGKIGTVLAALPPAQIGQAIATLSSAMPEGMAHALATQINEKDRALALQLAVGATKTDTGNYVATWMAKGQQAIKDKSIKEDAAAQTGLRAKLAEAIGDAVPGKAREDIIDAARLAYLGQKAEGYAVTPLGAVRIVLNGDVVEHNGRKIPTSRGIGLDQLRDRLASFPAAAIQKQAPDGQVYRADGRPQPIAEFLSELPQAALEPAGSGRYYVRQGAGLALNRAGSPIVIEVK